MSTFPLLYTNALDPSHIFTSSLKITSHEQNSLLKTCSDIKLLKDVGEVLSKPMNQWIQMASQPAPNLMEQICTHC